MKIILLILPFCIVLFGGCEKEANRKLLNAYFKYDINGKAVNVNQGILINENLFECKFYGDTAVQILAGKVYESAGIYISDANGITDKTYTLNHNNKATYNNPADQKRYTTTSKVTGTVTLKKGTYQAKTLLQTLEGNFEFRVIDSTTGKSFVITNGSFLMERQ